MSMMRTKRLWEERFHPSEKGWGIFDLALNAEKDVLLVAAFEKGLHRYRLDANTGSVTEKTQIKEKSGHRGPVTKVAWHCSGQRFATGGTDQIVIIWKDDFTIERQVKLPEAPQNLTWNPKAQFLHLLASAGTELVSINPPRDPLFYRLQSPILSLAWHHQGELYALALENGVVSVRDRLDTETCVINRPGGPVWHLCWAPPESPKGGLLAVVDWERKIGFYETTGKQKGRDHSVDFLPVSLAFSIDGQIIYACGADKKLHALSTECAYIAKIAEFRAWPLKCLPRRQTPVKADFLVISGDGMLNLMETLYDKCSHIHQGVYAARESLVNISVRNLEKNREITIPLQDSVRKIAVYRNLIAVQLSKTITILRQSPQDMMLKYEESTRVDTTIEYDQLLLAAQHLLLVKSTCIQAVNFTGALEESWTTNSEIRHIKVIGGKPGAETVLIAMQSGFIGKVNLNQAFIQNIVKVPSVPVCVDVNLDITKLAVVGENSILYVYDIATKEMLYQEPSADSCAWNLYHPDMIAFSMHSMLKIKLGEQKAHTRRMEAPLNGTIVGYAGSKVFYETDGRVVVVDVPHAMLIHQSMELGDFQNAYNIACFGVSDSDWKVLGNRALENLELMVAKSCIRRERNYPLLILIDELEQRTKVGDGNADLYRGDIFAYRGRFDEAARCYSSGGHPELAVKLFTDLRLFEQAEHWATTESQRRELLEMRAEWAVKADDKAEAVALLLQLGEVRKALDAMKDLGWGKRILDTARNLDTVGQRDLILHAATTLQTAGDLVSSVELLEKVKEIKSIVDMMLPKGDWDYLLGLADREPFYREMILLPYAQHLVENDRFTDARAAFVRAGHPEAATGILSQLVTVAVDIRRYNDAAFYHWLCARNSEEAGSPAETTRRLDDLAGVCYEYAVIEAAIEDPFIALSTETVFNCSRILAALLWSREEMPVGVQIGNVLFVLSVWAMKMQAYKTARIALERLKQLRLPKKLSGKFMETFVHNRTRPFQDPEDLSDYCHSCSSFSPLLNTRNGYSCQSCGNPFVYCHVSFEHLPLVEFTLAPGISNQEALTLIATDRAPQPVQALSNGLSDVMSFGDADQERSSSGKSSFGDWRRSGPIVANRKVLLELKEEDITVLKFPEPGSWKFYRNMLSDVARVVCCSSCWKVFNYDDYFAAVLDLGCCPFCRETKKLVSETDHED